MEKPSQYTHTFYLTAGETDATGHLPVPLLASRIIEVATEHANILGIGYATLVKRGIGWVLSRLSFEMTEYPGINEEYSLTTWIENYNRRFSERNFVVRGADGRVLGYVRTIWSAINFSSRAGADLSELERDSFPTADLPCPIAKTPRIPALGENCTRNMYAFRYCDLDFNRHVNTVRYLELVLDQWGLDHYDRYAVGRFDLLFHHECRYGESVELRVATEADRSHCELMREGVRVVAAGIDWLRRQEATCR